MQGGANHVGLSKRRKKRSFMQRVKRLTTNRNFISETRFESNEYEYFMQVFKMTRIFEGTEEEKIIFTNNALAQTESREVDCSSNQLISRVIESLLPLASNKVLERYFDAFSADLRLICNHGYASHVLQMLMVIATRQSLQECKSEDEKCHRDLCQKWVIKVSKYLLNNIEEYISETYANPVLRTAMFCLAGVPHLGKTNTQSEKNNSSFEQNNILKDVTIPEATEKPPEEYVKLLEEFFTRISKWPHFKDFVTNPLQSRYLQCLLTTLHLVNRDKYKIVMKKVLSECFPYKSNDNASVMVSPIGLPVLEVVIEKSGPKLLKRIFQKHFTGCIAEMASVKVANITLVKFLNKCESAELLAEALQQVLPELATILANGYGNLLVSVCQACERLKSTQSECFQGLVKAFNCENKLEELVPALLALKPAPLSTDTAKCTMQGSLLVQTLLNFQKPIKIVNSLLAYSPDQLTAVLCSNFGSHIASAFCKSEFVGEKNRQKLIQHLLGNFSELAISKFGSRSFDDIWIVADDKSKLRIVNDLSPYTSKVVGSNFGKYVAAKVRLQDFRKLGADKWKENLKRVQTKKKIFEPIIGDKRNIATDHELAVKKKKTKKEKCLKKE